MFDWFMQMVAPHLCVTCGSEGAVWCTVCRAAASPAIERCYKCHRLSPGGRTCKACRRASPLFSVRAATRYSAGAKRLVWKLKFERARAAGKEAGDLMARRLSQTDRMIIAHVPAVTSHVRRRGYDQAKLIAKAFAQARGTPLTPLLMRLGRKQQRGQSRQQRLAQLDGAFRVVRPERITGAHIVLVDDVITTGATLEAAARALEAAGARRVSAVVFAQA